jgi:hypothetical protein
MEARVARWFVFRPKIPIRENFWGPYIDWKRLTHFMSIWNSLQTFGIFYDHSAHFVFIWYIFSSLGSMHRDKSGNPELEASTAATVFFCFSLRNFLFDLCSEAKRQKRLLRRKLCVLVKRCFFSLKLMLWCCSCSRNPVEKFFKKFFCSFKSGRSFFYIKKDVDNLTLARLKFEASVWQSHKSFDFGSKPSRPLFSFRHFQIFPPFFLKTNKKLSLENVHHTEWSETILIFIFYFPPPRPAPT